jgi:hypothetical protein
MNRPHTLSPGFEPGTNLCSVQNSADSAGHKLVMVTLGEASQDSVPDWNVKYVSLRQRTPCKSGTPIGDKIRYKLGIYLCATVQHPWLYSQNSIRGTTFSVPFK